MHNRFIVPVLFDMRLLIICFFVYMKLSFTTPSMSSILETSERSGSQSGARVICYSIVLGTTPLYEDEVRSGGIEVKWKSNCNPSAC